MNKIVAKVIKVDRVDKICVLELNFYEELISVVYLDDNEKVKVGLNVKLEIKPFDITIAKNLNGKISYLNRLKAKIISIEEGKLLSNVKLKVANTVLESIVFKRVVKEMELKEKDEVILFIKESDFLVVEVIGD